MHSPEEDDDKDEDPEIVSWILQLRAVLEKLRLVLYREKLNLQLEHHRSVGGSASCCWSIFNSAVAAGEEAGLEPQRSQPKPVIAEDSADLDLAGFYKSKINELEADCCEGLNRIRSRFTESSSSSSSGSFDRVKNLESADVSSELPLLLDSKSSSTRREEEPVETLWTAIDDPFSEADFSSLMNEARAANESFGS